jgi:hypothetical protein
MKHRALLIFTFLVATLSFGQVATNELPDAPTPQPRDKAPSFFAFGHWNADKPLRTNAQTVKSISFWGPQVLQYGAIAASIARTRHSPSAPKGGELYVDALVPAVIISAMSYGADRLLWRPLGLGLTSFVIFRHTRAAITGRYP